MFQLSVVHLDAGKILIFNNLYIINDSFEKKWWQDVLNFITTRDRLIDWLFSYDQAMLFSEVCQCQRDFNKCCRNLLFTIEQGFEYNKIESKIISPYSLYEHAYIYIYIAYILENYSQIRSELSVLLSEKKLY